MSFLTNMKQIHSEIYDCLSSNGVNISENNVYIVDDERTGELMIKAFTNDKPSRHFSMRMRDKFIVCEEDENILYDVSPFKKPSKRTKVSRKRVKEHMIRYANYLFETGDITEEELKQDIKHAEDYYSKCPD